MCTNRASASATTTACTEKCTVAESCWQANSMNLHPCKLSLQPLLVVPEMQLPLERQRMCIDQMGNEPNSGVGMASTALNSTSNFIGQPLKQMMSVEPEHGSMQQLDNDLADQLMTPRHQVSIHHTKLSATYPRPLKGGELVRSVKMPPLCAWPQPQHKDLQDMLGVRCSLAGITIR